MVPTMQRIAIIDVLRGSDAHPTADMVFREVSAKHPSISRATVYNTLHALVDAGLVHELSIDKEAARYDFCRMPHAHFRCRACRSLYDVALAPSVGAGEIVDGHLVEAVSTYLFGLCASCRSDLETDRA